MTGAGKSSLSCLLLGAELEKDLTWEKDGKKYKFHHNNHMYPKIGNTNESCTFVPSVTKMDKNNNLYDPAGFLDTKGVLQEILNSFCNSKMFQTGSKVKIVIVLEESSL